MILLFLKAGLWYLRTKLSENRAAEQGQVGREGSVYFGGKTGEKNLI